ncbi:MAG: hypothetical protein E7642_01945 [Ruminococcaceae bacterium]|nr:hypothetical protein [Oscillospiraceae bacterium]
MATTKAIVYSGAVLDDVKLNEVHIYRVFGSKENLYAQAFRMLDEEIFVNGYRAAMVFADKETPAKENFKKFFNSLWRFILGNEDKCRYYVRFYYSVYFRESAHRNHRENFANGIALFKDQFKEEADVRSLLHSTFTTLLDFAIRVYNGDLEDTQSNADHIFNLLYCSLMCYFKNSTMQLI